MVNEKRVNREMNVYIKWEMKMYTEGK